jgi:hypothetical protein
MKQFYKLEDCRSDIQSTYDKGIVRGYFLAWEELRSAISIMLGYPLVIYGPPYSGKTQLAFEIMIQLSELYGATWAVASPETGDAATVFTELVEMVAQKDITNNNNNQMSEAEKMAAEVWINDHFYVLELEVDDDENIDITTFYKTVDEIALSTGKAIWGTLLDTFDDVDIDWGSGPRDLQLQKTLKYVRKNAKKTGRCHIVVCHLAGQTMVTKTFGKGDDRREYEYYPPPYPQQIIHGNEWFRRMFTMLGVWRPPTFLRDFSKRQYEENSTMVLFGKRKPKNVFRKGDTTKGIHLNWDAKRNRYYYVDSNGYPLYASSQQEIEKRLGLTEY